VGGGATLCARLWEFRALRHNIDAITVTVQISRFVAKDSFAIFM
jgi:uncharacterized RDD family membrane protein YckC